MKKGKCINLNSNKDLRNLHLSLLFFSFQHCLQKMDKRVEKILKNVKKNSLVIVIVPGRTDPECENAGTVFVKIKE